MHQLLLIDDNPSDLDTTVLALRHVLPGSRIERYLVEIDPRGSRALPDPAHHRPDLILVDYMLGYCTADEILPLLRRAHPQVPVVVLSTTTDRALRARMAAAGADDCLAKPFTLSEARELVDHLGLQGRITAPT